MQDPSKKHEWKERLLRRGGRCDGARVAGDFGKKYKKIYIGMKKNTKKRHIKLEKNTKNIYTKAAAKNTKVGKNFQKFGKNRGQVGNRYKI